MMESLEGSTAPNIEFAVTQNRVFQSQLVYKVASLPDFLISHVWQSSLPFSDYILLCLVRPTTMVFVVQSPKNKIY